VHANSAHDALTRLETLVLFADVGLPLAAVRAQLVSAVDAIVHVARRRGGVRAVEAIGEVIMTGDRPALRPLFVHGPAHLERVASPTRVARRADAPALAGTDS
jgi:pilus assembly protein CpaF